MHMTQQPSLFLLLVTTTLLSVYGEIKNCPHITLNLVKYSTLPKAGETLKGICLDNSEREDDDVVPTIVCRKNGNFTTIGQCLCQPGFFKVDHYCKECQSGHTKSETGNHKCIHPGRNTLNCGPITHICPCKEKFFRVTEEKSIPGTHCYEPGLVRKIYYSNFTDGSALVTWRSPFYKAGYKAVYLVSTNNGKYKRTQNRKLSFPKSNYTRHYNIKIITEVKVGDKAYQGDVFSNTITVHETRYNHAAEFKTNVILLSLFLAVSILMLR